MAYSYNCRVYSYESGQHVTFYASAITRGSDALHVHSPRKDVDTTDRTEEAEEHCERVSCAYSKNKVYRIARSNTWEWFITLTFDRTRTDASDYDVIVNRLQIFLEHMRQRKCPDMKYLIVPELHADKEHYHFHGLLANVDGMAFRYSGRNDKKSGRLIYNLPEWTWGFTTATMVGDSAKASSYITKYITKDEDRHLKEKRRFYYSRNCAIAEEQLCVIDEEDFRRLYADRITYAKSVNIPQAHQHINYYELKW